MDVNDKDVVLTRFQSTTKQQKMVFWISDGARSRVSSVSLAVVPRPSLIELLDPQTPAATWYKDPFLESKLIGEGVEIFFQPNWQPHTLALN